MKLTVRQRGLNALGVGLAVWGVQIALVKGAGVFSPLLMVLGTVGVAAGAVLLFWGESYEKMPPAQKLPAALISLMSFGLVGALLARWLGRA